MKDGIRQKCRTPEVFPSTQRDGLCKECTINKKTWQKEKEMVLAKQQEKKKASDRQQQGNGGTGSGQPDPDDGYEIITVDFDEVLEGGWDMCD